MIPMMVLSGAMFSFEKLNRTVSSIGKTPWIADLMPTKWTYEALMVHQFKDNRYQKIFYELNKIQSIADFKNVYYLPELEKRLANCEKEYTASGKIERTTDDLLLLKNELSVQTHYVPSIAFPDLCKLTKDSLTKEVIHNIHLYLTRLKNYYTYLFMMAANKKEDTIAFLTRQGSGYLKKLKDDYHNESVEDIVTKVYEKNKILVYRHQIIQNTDPIYLDPPPAENPLNFRAHFMAPVKYFSGRYFDTYIFNIGVVWMYTGILYILLYFKVLKNILSFFEKIKAKNGM